MQYSPHIPTVRVYLERIRRNYRLLAAKCAEAAAGGPTPLGVLPAAYAAFAPPAREVKGDGYGAAGIPCSWPALMPVVKADAYGHGHIQVAAALMREGAKLFASGSVREALELRRGLRELELGDSTPLIVTLLGTVGCDDLRACAQNGIIPVLHSLEQCETLAGAETSLAVAVKCDTGMARLGFGADEIPLLVEKLRGMPHVTPVLALSHLASADSEDGREHIRRQGALFARMVAALREAWPHLAASLGNSAGSLLAGEITTTLGPHICRPGLALYGGNPLAGTSLGFLGKDLAQAMEVCTPVLAVRDIAAGAGVGYGHTFIAQKNMRIAVIAAGYADCFTRGLSNRGEVCIRGTRAPIVGRISMQMTALDVSAVPDTRMGDMVWLMGGPFDAALSVQDLACSWDTIPYEAMCLLGYNTRIHIS